MIEPYRYASGETYGEPDRTPVPASSYTPPRPRLSLAKRARLAKRRRETDPDWGSRSPESRALLLALDAREERGLQ